MKFIALCVIFATLLSNQTLTQAVEISPNAHITLKLIAKTDLTKIEGGSFLPFVTTEPITKNGIEIVPVGTRALVVVQIEPVINTVDNRNSLQAYLFPKAVSEIRLEGRKLFQDQAKFVFQKPRIILQIGTTLQAYIQPQLP